MATLEQENELIKANMAKPDAKKVHKFKPAEWTHGNGHPRCLTCGDEEPSSGMCNRMFKSEEFIENEECPYLAGYSEDGRHFYLDKRFNPIFQLKDGRRMDTRKYLMIHEKTEKQHEDATGQSYQHSHELATGAERKAVEADGYPWQEYQNYCLREAKRLTPLDAEVPGDIDLKPERDYGDKKMIRKVRSLQKSNPVKSAGEKLAHLIREHRMLMHTLKHLDKPGLAKGMKSEPSFSHADVVASAKKTGNDILNGSDFSERYRPDQRFNLIDVPVSSLYRGKPEGKRKQEFPREPMHYESDEDEKYAQKFASKYKSNSTAEPIIVHPDEHGGHEIVDGRHRARAAFLRGESHIKAFVPKAKPMAKGMDLDLERRAKYLDNLPEQPANRPEVQPVMGGLGTLAKGANGDWQKEGYTIHHEIVPSNIPSWYPQGKLQVFAKDKDGNIAATASINHAHSKSLMKPRGISVGEGHERKGLATAMYAHAEKVMGKKMIPQEGHQSPSGAALWKQPSRPFGRKNEKKIENYTEREVDEYSRKLGMDFKKSDLIPGGLAQGKTNKDFPGKKIKQGEKVEMEHTTSKKVADEIARDHLTEDPNYYNKLATLEKARPTYEGEVDQKGNRAVKHRQVSSLLVWEHAPDKQKNFQDLVNRHIKPFTQKLSPEHQSIINHVAERIQKDPTRHYVESTHPQTKLQVPKLRHLAALVSGNPSANVQPMDNGNLLWRQDRHGSVEPHTYWELSQHGVKDVTADMKTQKKLKKSMYPLFGNPKKTEKASAQRRGTKTLNTPAKLKRPKAKAATPGTLQKSVVLQVSTVAVINGDHILMGRRKDSGKLTFPGGHADAGEHPEQAAKRELFEEAGINAKDLHYIGQEDIVGRDGKARMINCFVTFGYYNPTNKNDPDEEISEWYWVPMVSFRKEGIFDELDPQTADELHSKPNAILNLLGIRH